MLMLGMAAARAAPPGDGAQAWLADFATYATSGFLWNGALLAVEITAAAMSCGLVLGLGLALMRISRIRAIRAAAGFYIFVTRGTPQLLQLVFIFDALPFIGLRLDSLASCSACCWARSRSSTSSSWPAGPWVAARPINGAPSIRT